MHSFQCQNILFGSQTSNQKEVIRALERAGYFIHESTGSHVQLKHPKKSERITVPWHARYDLPKHILKSIIKQAGLTNKQFFELRKK